MNGGKSQTTTPGGLGAFALSHWELLALLRVLKIEAIPGQDDDVVAKANAKLNLSSKDVEARIEVALQDLTARGFVDVIPTPDAQRGDKPKFSVVVPTPVLSQLAVCATSWYSLRILTMINGEQAESYLHEWKQLGVVHGIDSRTASHIFIPVYKRDGILSAVSQLTDGESRATPAHMRDILGTIAASLLQRIITEASRGDVNTVAELLRTSGLKAEQREFAETLAGNERGVRFDEISFAYSSRQGLQQANALRLQRGNREYFCFTGWYTSDNAAVYTVIHGGKGAAARWVEPLLGISDL